MILALDFTKAFDSVRWEFIKLTMRWFGFGPLFTDMIDLIFNQIETSILNAGNTSNFFLPGRGIRQGCCVSPYLFILVVEVMATHIRNNQAIQGLQLGEEEVKITQFADDSTCVLKRLTSLPPLLSFLKEFASWSGLTINKSKSMILLPNKELSGIKGLHGILVVSRVKILGIWFTSRCSTEDHLQLNFKPQLGKIKSVCDLWNARNLSMKGKVTLVNSLMVSLLQYQCSSIYTPPQVYKDYKKLVTDFIWGGRKPKVAFSKLTLPVAHGGLHVMDLETRVKVSVLQWVRRLVKKPQSNTGQSLKHLLQVKCLTTHFLCKLQHIPERVKSIPFYSSLFALWNEFHAVPLKDEDAIRRERIWSNKFITIEGESLSRSSWERRGIITINDLCQPGENRLHSHVEIRDNYDIKCSFLDALQIRLAIPLAWRQALTADWREPPLPPSLSSVDITLPGEQPLDIVIAGPKLMYKALILQKGTRTMALQRWSDTASAPLYIKDEEEWREMNLNVYRATRETKLQSLHFKIMNRILPCNKYLKQIRIKGSDACERCGQVDSMTHFLFECPSIKIFWQALCRWFDGVENLHLETLSLKQFVFGVPRDHPKSTTVNFILICTKFFIFRQGLFHEGKVEMLHWLREFKMKLLMEKQICLQECKAQRFRRWSAILNALG